MRSYYFVKHHRNIQLAHLYEHLVMRNLNQLLHEKGLFVKNANRYPWHSNRIDAYCRRRAIKSIYFGQKMRFYRSSQSLRTRSGKKSMISIISHHLKTTTCHQSILLTKRRNKRQSLLHYTLLREIQRLTILPTRPPCSMWQVRFSYEIFAITSPSHMDFTQAI